MTLTATLDHVNVVPVLIDSGALGFSFMDKSFANKLGLKFRRKSIPLPIRTADGNPLGTGKVIYEKCELQLVISGHVEQISFSIMQCPHHPVILGLNWLREHNPSIDWRQGTLDFNRCDHSIPSTTVEPVQEPAIDLCLISSREVDTILTQDDDARVILAYYNANDTNQECTNDLPSSDDPVINDLINRNQEVFSTSDFPSLPPHRDNVDLKIDLLPGAIAPFGPIYSLSREEEKALQRYLEKALEAGIIRPSTSSAGSPVMFIKKSDGTLRLCVDYRGLNSVTATNRAALPIIDDMLRHTTGSKYFSKIDLKSAFNLVRIAPGYEHLTAFRTKMDISSMSSCPLA